MFVALVQAFGVGIIVTIADAFAGLAALGVVLLLAVLLTFYFLRDGFTFWRMFLERVEPGRRSHVKAAGSRAFDVLGGYMLGTGAISAFGAATQFLIMAILGIPFALPLAVLSFFGGFIPYIGSFVTTGLAFLVTVATGDPTDIVIMAIFTIVFNIVQGNFVAPIVYSRVVSLHPAVVLRGHPGRRRTSRASSGCSWSCRSSASSRQRGGRSCGSWTRSRRRFRRWTRTKPPTSSDEIGRPGPQATVVAPGT